MKISVAARDDACNDICGLVDVSGPGTLEIFTGSPPTHPADPDSGTLLATLTFSATAFGASSSGTATANAITSDTDIDATGAAGHFRIKDGTGAVVMQGTCGTSGADINFNTISFVQHGTVGIASLSVSVPEGS